MWSKTSTTLKNKLIPPRSGTTEMWTESQGEDLYLNGLWFSTLPHKLLKVAGKEITSYKSVLYYAERPKRDSLAPICA